jgi:glycosyltransferase involved in cell wall biosynthesis
MKLVGMMLIRNEDIFIERVIRNILPACDELIIADHQSVDGTAKIVESLRQEFPDRIQVHRIRSSDESHELVRGYAGSDSWILAVDGDEIYDPEGLLRMKKKLVVGEYRDFWMVIGGVLNVRKLDGAFAMGHFAPPSRSMTKLFNFSAIDDWAGPCIERLHGGTIRFRPGFHANLRLSLHFEQPWEEQDFRCLHICFLRRSSLEPENGFPRKNIMDVRAWSLAKASQKLLGILIGSPAPNWKEQKYARGPLHQQDVSAFFPPTMSGDLTEVFSEGEKSEEYPVIQDVFGSKA